MDHELERIRREYKLHRLDENTLPSGPMKLLEEWLAAATRSKSLDPTAMTLSTVDDQGAPSSRVVLLKKIEGDKLVFFSNFHSRKAREIKNNPRVAAHFYWPELERQIKIAGHAGVLKDAHSDRYFRSRPFESKVAAWASPQSEEVPDRDFLEKAFQKYLARFKASGEVPRPAYWGGFYIKPFRVEFWQGGGYRLHDRIEYRLMDDAWSRVRLAP